jgi:outer membrane protein, multidrug efflux system
MRSNRAHLSVVAAAAAVFSGSVGFGASELTFEQALRQARKSNRTLTASQARLEQVRTTLSQAWAALFPAVTAQGKYTRNNVEVSFPLTLGSGGATKTVTIQPANQLDGVLNFTMPLVAPPAYGTLKAAKASVRAAQADYETSLNDVLYSVAQTFYTAAIADEIVAARQSSIEVARATAQLAETRYSLGAVTKTDVDRALLALVRAEQAEREARFSRDQTYRALATLMQTEGEFTIRTGTPRAPLPDVPSLASALSLRPEFRALELGATSFALQARAFAWRWSPTLSAFGNLHLFNYEGFAQRQYTWAVGVELDWVIYDGGIRDAQRRQASAQARETRIRGEILRDTIRDDLANQREQLDTKHHAQDAAERQVALAQETLGLVRTQYQAGAVAEIDLLRAQDDLTAAKEALAQAHLEVALADLALRRAAGTFPGNQGQ